ncbi:MAG: glycosyltransferase [Gemmataceae bacterium]|nr:glycosyltransferase [Gemmataceae bacterium]MDW8265812.1 glycosyltransferase [Gemmataceae bacterium]
MRVSLCMIVKNEEADLPGCLASAADLVDEIIVVDTGSTDRTKEIAASFGAKVYDFEWCDSFAAARNESIRHATGDWIFWLDADDRLDEPTREKLRRIFANLQDEIAAYMMKCLCNPDPSSGRSAILLGHARLFRNHPNVRWKYRVHEQIMPAVERMGGRVHWTDVIIHHSGYQDAVIYRQKQERNLRLLMLDLKDNPNDAFVLFYIGWIYLNLQKPVEALPYLKASLERASLGDSYVPKLFSLLVNTLLWLGHRQEALAMCLRGQQIYQDDTELLFQKGTLLHEAGDLAGAEVAFQRLLAREPIEHYGCVDPGLRAFKTRHNLAVLYMQQGRIAEAETQWRILASQCPDFGPAWLELADIWVKQGREGELVQTVQRLEADPKHRIPALLLRSRWLRANRRFDEARQLLQQAIAREPHNLGLRVALSHVYMEEGRDLPATIQALRDVLAIEPNYVQAEKNLAALLQQQRGGQPAMPVQVPLQRNSIVVSW